MDSDKYLLGIDLGTSVCKSAIFGVDGRVLAVTRGEYPMECPYPGWAEQDQNLWWSEVTRTIRENLSKAKISPKDIVGIGCCGMSRGVSLIGKDGRILRKCIINMDRRAVKQDRWIREYVKFSDGRRHEEQMPTAAKLLWVKENEPDIWKGIYKILLPKSFIVWKLTGKFADEPLDASMTDMFDRAKNDWSDEALNAYGIPREKLAEIRKPWDILGGVTELAAKETGLVEGTQVVVGAWDGSCQTYGAGFVKAGRVLDRTGTVGGFTVAVEKSPDFSSFSLVPNISSISTGGVRTAGVSLRWARDQFCELEKLIAEKTGIDAYQLMDQEAENVEPGSEGIFFVPYLIGRTGPMNRYGLIFGITLETKREQIIRAVMEGFGYEIRRGKEKTLDAQGIKCGEVWTTGGGGKSRVWRQIKADILGLTYCRTNVDETGCLGAAVIAGYGVGVYSDLVSPIEAIVKVVERNEPRPQYKKRYDELFQAYKKLNELLENSGIYDEYVKALENGGIFPE
ncbi:MAG: FGGY family carbohydrate kinase [Candidatus Bathyarchaeota archaeon]